MEFFITILVVVIIVYFVVFKKGNYAFWRKAQRQPDMAYHYFLENECWRVEDDVHDHEQPSRANGRWHGPFKLIVPSIGRTVTIYGKVGLYESSQDILEALLDSDD